jgi:hypothetical protein
MNTSQYFIISAPRFAKTGDGSLSMGRGGAADLPPPFAEFLLV